MSDETEPTVCNMGRIPPRGPGEPARYDEPEQAPAEPLPQPDNTETEE